MEQSENINELAAALAKAQGEITGALKDSSNPFFKSKYADLASCWDACRKQLSENSLAVIQTTTERDGIVYVVTTLAHASGQWMKGWLPVKCKDDGPQAQGSGLTYARRYALAGMVGLAQIDDDAESAQARNRVVPTNHGITLTPKQKDYAQEFADGFRRILSADIEEGEKMQQVKELSDEANEDQIVYIEAAKLLTAAERAAIKKYVAIARKEAA